MSGNRSVQDPQWIASSRSCSVIGPHSAGSAGAAEAARSSNRRSIASSLNGRICSRAIIKNLGLLPVHAACSPNNK
ncbi:unnamed protein product [Lota lota]